MGVVRTPESQEETRGLTRSDDISRMLPSEAQMLAASKAGPNRTGVKAARLLHYARRLERTLLTYERVGWTDTPAQTRNGTVRTEEGASMHLWSRPPPAPNSHLPCRGV